MCILRIAVVWIGKMCYNCLKSRKKTRKPVSWQITEDIFRGTVNNGLIFLPGPDILEIVRQKRTDEIDRKRGLCVSKKIHKNGFVEGAAIAYVAIVITKLMGAIYNIPFYNIIGDKGGIIYSYAYSIYGLFLDISTSGIPIAISIVISEYNSLGKFRSKEKAYHLGLRVVLCVSLAAFLFLQIFSRQIGGYFLKDMTEGVSVDEIAFAVRAVSYCLLIVPFLSMKRGYLQGHKFLAPPSHSQVIEQFVRILFVLGGSYVAIRVLHTDVTIGVGVALIGAAVGAVAAQMYLVRAHYANREQFPIRGGTERKAEPTKKILRDIFSHCATLVLVSITMSVYNLVDLKMLLLGLHKLSYDDEVAQLVSSIASTWIPKICMIISALSIGLTSSIAPFIAENYAKGKWRAVNLKINQAMGTVLAVSVPLGIGMIMFAEPVYRLFYGESLYGGGILQLAIVVNILGSMTTVISMAMQSMSRGKSACIFTVIGVIINTALDLPLIYLFDAMGIPAYWGASAASIVGQLVTLLLLLASLKRSIDFSYRPMVSVILRMLPAAALMSVVVLAVRHLWPVTQSRGILLIVQFAVYGLAGALVYVPMTYRSKVLSDVFGKKTVARVRRKLGLEKR